MAKKFPPEHWIGNYARSASNGKTIPIRLRRILTIVLLPIWVISLLAGGINTGFGVAAILKTEELKKAIATEDKTNGKYDPESRKIVYNSRYGNEKFISESDYRNELENDLQNAEDNRYLAWALPGVIFFGFFLPWLLTRLTFWVIDAKEEDQSLITKF